MRSLTHCLHRFQREGRLLWLLFRDNRPHSHGLWLCPQETAGQSYAVLRLHEAWARFCRELVLTSARGQVVTSTGAVVRRSPLVSQMRTPLVVLKASYPPSRQRKFLWEPKWFDAGEAIDAARRLKISNFAEVSAGLGVAGHALDELRACRNFLAHRGRASDDEFDIVRSNHSLYRFVAAEEALNNPVEGGVTLFEFWHHDILRRARLAVQ